MNTSHFFLFGLNHKTSPVEIREKVAFTPQNIVSGLQAMKDAGIGSPVILSTCSRVEIYGMAGKQLKEEDIADFLAGFHRVTDLDVKPYAYCLRGPDAAKHLFRVAASLDSMMVGEKQILKQVKESFALSVSLSYGAGIVRNLFEAALKTGQDIHTGTNIGPGSLSVASIVLRMMKDIFGDLTEKTIFLLGTGKMGEITANHLHALGITRILLSSRMEEEGKIFSQRLHARVVAFSDRMDAIKHADIVVVSTAEPHPVIYADAVRKHMPLRKGQPLFFVDLSVPRNIDPLVRDIPGVYLYDMDDLAVVKSHHFSKRMDEIVKAEEIIRRGLDECREFFEEEQVTEALRWIQAPLSRDAV